MIEVPVAIPVAIPVAEPMVATVGALLLQAPPDVASVSVVEEPIQTPVLPAIAAGDGSTVTVWVAYAVPQELVTI